MDTWSKRGKGLSRFELAIFIGVIVCVLYYSLFMRGIQADEREHIYASFLIYKGFIPYRDFFEHHHPLMWCLFYPLMCFFHNSAYIWFAARGFALLILGGQCYFISKICRFVSVKMYFALFAVLFFTVSENVLYNGCQFRPDNLMIMLFLAGLYCWLCYVKNGWQSALNLSFVLFFLAVLALQKVIIMILPVALVSLRMTCCGQMKWGAVGKAMMLPAIFTLAFIAFCYHTDSLKDYFELNWLLNFKQKFDFKDTVYGTAYCWCAMVAVVGALFFTENNVLKIISFLLLATFGILQFFVYTPWKQYWLPVYPYFAILTAYWMVKWKSLTVRLVLLTGVLIASIVHLVNFVRWNNGDVPMRHFVFLSQQVLRLSEPEDLIVGNNATLGGLRYEAAGYYWFERGYTARLDYQNFHRHNWPDIEMIIKLKRPKIVVNDTVLERVSDEMVFSHGSCRSVPLIFDDEFMNEHYDNYGYIYVRKY